MASAAKDCGVPSAGKGTSSISPKKATRSRRERRKRACRRAVNARIRGPKVWELTLGGRVARMRFPQAGQARVTSWCSVSGPDLGQLGRPMVRTLGAPRREAPRWRPRLDRRATKFWMCVPGPFHGV